MTREEDQTESALNAPILALPDSIREHRALVDLAEWLLMRYPTRLSLNTHVRERLYIKAA